MLAAETGPFLYPDCVALMASRGGSRPALIFRAFVDGAHTPAAGHESEPFRPRRFAPVADATAHEKSPGRDVSHGRGGHRLIRSTRHEWIDIFGYERSYRRRQENSRDLQGNNGTGAGPCLYHVW
jgi:hypothetical protein